MIFTYQGATYDVQPLSLRPDRLRVVLTLTFDGERYSGRLDLYNQGERREFAYAAAGQFLGDDTNPTFFRDLNRLVGEVEAVRDQKVKEAAIARLLEAVKALSELGFSDREIREAVFG